MRVGRHLRVGQLAFVAVTMLMGLAAVIVLRVTTTTSNRLTYEFVAQARDVHELRLHLEQFTSVTRGYLLNGNPRYRVLRDQARTAIVRELAEVRAGSHAEEDLDPAARMFTEYVDVTARAMAMRDERGKFDEEFIAREVRPRRRAIEAHLGEMLAHEDAALAEAFASASRMSRAGQLMLAGTGLALVVLGFVLAEALRRKLAEQFAAVEAATEAADRAAAARKELLNVVSHDLRSPLNAIMLNLDVIASGGPAEPRLDAIRRSADRMQRLIEELVDVARVETGRLELYPSDVELADLVGALGPMYAAQAESRGITLDIDPPSGSIRVDRDRIQRVLCNLVDNALKFTPPGGQVRVAASTTTDRAHFEVIDTGPGIAAEDADRIFARAWQSPERRRSGGLGLGLYICERIVKTHGGTIGVISTPGTGSTFWFEVPRVAPVNASVAG